MQVVFSTEVFLAQYAFQQYALQIPFVAASLENQIFMDALSENDYLDQQNFLDRLMKVIKRSWESGQHEAMHTTTSLPKNVSASTLATKNIFCKNIDKPHHDKYVSDDACFKSDHAPELLADVPWSRIYGSQKCILDANVWQPELVLPNNYSSGMGFFNADSGDSEITYTGSGLQYDSEASFESHCNQYQNSAKGETNFNIFSDQNDPSLYSPATVRENLKFEVSTVSDGLHMRQPVLGPLQFNQPLLHCDGHFTEIKTVGSLPVQNRNLYTSPRATSTPRDTQQLSKQTENLNILYSYINYKKDGHKVPFLEYIHSLKCKDGCECETYRGLLTHYDSCGSADCDTCGSAARGFIQSGLRNQGNGFVRLTHGNDSGKRVRANTSEDFIYSAKLRKLDSSPRRDSPCDVSALSEEPFSPSGPLNFEQLSKSPVMATPVNPGENAYITTSHTDDVLRISESDNSHLDDALGFKYGDAIIPSEGPSFDCSQKVERVSCHIDDAARISLQGNVTISLYDTRGSNSGDATNFADHPSADSCQKEIEPVVNELKDTVPDPGCDLPSDYVPYLFEDKSIAQRVEFIPRSDSEDIHQTAGSRTRMKGFKSVDAIIPSEDPSSNCSQKAERASCHIDDAARISQQGNGATALYDTCGSKSDNATNFADDPSAYSYQKEIEPVVDELKDTVSDPGCDLPSDYVPNLFEDKPIAQKVEFIPRSDSKEIHQIAGPRTRMKSEKQKVDGISLIDFFTPEEIKRHLSSLKQRDDQGIAGKMAENGASCSLSENFCQLCALPQLAFSPMPLYCLFCGARIKNHATYYATIDKTSDQLCFCTTCYNKCHRGTFTLYGLSISKSNLKTQKNDLVTVESWVQCDRCEGWQHQICALFNDKKDLGGDSEYLCPKCYLEDLEFEGLMPLPRSSSLDAHHLPQTLLSDHLEQRLFGRLKQERENRAKAAGKNPEEVPCPADLAVRVVSSVDKRLKVKQQFLDIFPENGYPAEFPYRSKVILLFQRIEGVDVCLFAMYVQEFGSACSLPNQRCVYISYLDSVKYFRPETKTLKGEALRTFVYHEILIGYLDYCKKRGFATCYIWACPPVKGEDYILYCHPETQKTPKPDKLRLWYQSMLKKATEEKIVVNFSNLYEKFFVPTGERKTKVTAARLPYFDGDYWSSVVESMIKKIDLESGGDPEKQLKKKWRSVKAFGHSNPSANDVKDVLLMQALGHIISSAKEDFIIVNLQSVCTNCHEIILSGQRWFCNQCKNYQLCARCHDVTELVGPGDTHISSGGQRHALSQEVVNDVPTDTEDNDAIMDNCFLENRHALLSFCQGNHYQFDSLRRAKHSSMMILYYLHYPNGSVAGISCNLCLKETGADQRWVKQLLDVLLHASQCHTTVNLPCSYPNCSILRRLFSHAHACNIRIAGGCRHCKKTWFILLMHSRRCKDPSCNIPRCMDLKNHEKMLES
uniref:histone acetyltransferase n=1 Tax=Chenopodium quinoa TaxID=63459 RepID=A0A803LKP9_CHEQI